MATFGEYTSTSMGFFMTNLGALLAAIKTIVTNRVQVGPLKLHPMDLLLRMSPLAFIQCMLCAYFAGEWDGIRIWKVNASWNAIYGAVGLTESSRFS